MSLIKCPECGKEISDKSKQCIHCGYPLNDLYVNDEEEKSNSKCIINGTTYDFIEFIKLYNNNLPYTALEYFNKNYRFENRNINVYLIQYFDTNKSFPTELDLKEVPVLTNKEASDIIFNIIKKYQKEEKQKLDNNKSCPKCGCTEFVPLRRKFSLLTGFATNKVDMVCSKCGTKIK